MPGCETFGSYLRGARLGYHYVPLLDAFMRVTDSMHGALRVHLVRDPRDMEWNDHRGGQKLHYCWWEGDKDGSLMISMSAALKALTTHPKGLGYPKTLILNDEGDSVEG